MSTALTRQTTQTPSFSPVDQLFGSFADRFFNRFLEGSPALATDSGSWVPSTDIRETDSAFELHADLPGMTKKDVELTFEDNVLTLNGERRVEEKTEDKGFRRIERSYGKFTRSFRVPTHIDADGIKASFKDGVLTVTLPKSAEAQPRKLSIS